MGMETWGHRPSLLLDSSVAYGGVNINEQGDGVLERLFRMLYLRKLRYPKFICSKIIL